MFDRLQKPFLTVETGEAYQPIRLTYNVLQPEKLIELFSKLDCSESKQLHVWDWLWKGECNDLHFESLDTYKKNRQHPLRLGTFTLKDSTLYLNLASFKRACLAVPFFYRVFNGCAKIRVADFINKVFGLNERLTHGFTELFSEEELDKIIQQRISDYHVVQERCERAKTAENAFTILTDYAKTESQKRLPYAERYSFDLEETANFDDTFLAFYIFLRSRELIAIRRWFGEAGYSLTDAIDETMQQVFGDMDLDIIE